MISIDTTSHDLGVQSEHVWLKRYYPNFEYPMQYIDYIQTEQGNKMFDVFPISSEKMNKDIYFDITNFYHEPIECLMDTNEYNIHKIKRLYRKTEKMGKLCGLRRNKWLNCLNEIERLLEGI